MVRQVDPPQQAAALLLLREVQEELDDAEAVLGQVALPVVDRAVAPLPDVPLVRRLGQLLALEVLGVDADDEHLLVVGSVEDADLAARRQAARVAPEKVVVELLGRRDLEAVDRDALRVDAAHHVADRPVLAGRVERLEDDEDAPGVLSGQPRLVLRQQRTPSASSSAPSFFFLTPALNAGSKSFARTTFEPGFTRNGAMNSSNRFLRFLSTSGSARRDWLRVPSLRPDIVASS